MSETPTTTVTPASVPTTAVAGAGTTTVTYTTPSTETKPEPQQEPDKGFPDATPLAEMTVDQQAAYWKDKARKHEQRANARGDYDDLKAKADQFDEYKRQQMSEHEKAVEAARNEGRQSALEEANKNAVTAILRANLTARGKSSEEADEILAAVSPSAFIGESGPDTDKVTAFVTRIAGSIQAAHLDMGQGDRSPGPKSQEDADYEALYPNR